MYTSENFNMTFEEVMRFVPEDDFLAQKRGRRCRKNRMKLMLFAEEFGACKFVLNDVERQIVKEQWWLWRQDCLERELRELSQLSEGSGDLFADIAAAVCRHEKPNNSSIERRIAQIEYMLKTGNFSTEEEKHPVEYDLHHAYYNVCA